MIIYYLFRILLYPFLLLLCAISKDINKRFSFEKRFNLERDDLKEENVDQYDYVVEYSSEGELELALPLIKTLLKEGKKLELIFCSESVLHASLKLKDENPGSVRLFCLPVLSFLPFGKNNIYKRLTASQVIFTRYDFFPEFISFSNKKKSYLISGSVKKFLLSPNILKKIYLKWVYKSFNKILMSTDQEKDDLLKHFGLEESKVRAFDFRCAQVIDRIKNKEKKLINKGVKPFFDSLEKSKRKKIIYGSFWNDEVDFLFSSPSVDNQNMVHLFVPHKLDAASIDGCFKILSKRFDCPIEVLTTENILDTVFDEDKVYILNIKGILCEVYSYFDYAYVAGGFRNSVHSLLEPFFSSCCILCGPRTQKSTEYDTILNEDASKIKIISEVPKKEELASLLNSFEDTLESSDVTKLNIIKFLKTDEYKKWLLDIA